MALNLIIFILKYEKLEFPEPGSLRGKIYDRYTVSSSILRMTSQPKRTLVSLAL